MYTAGFLLTWKTWKSQGEKLWSEKSQENLFSAKSQGNCFKMLIATLLFLSIINIVDHSIHQYERACVTLQEIDILMFSSVLF